MDETHLRILDGPTGNVLFETCNTTGTFFENPVVADVDGDGHADLVVPSNAYSSLTCNGGKTTGIRVFGDDEGRWVRTRRVWNQHAYHVTNVEDDGTIPAVEPPHFSNQLLNAFRLSIDPTGRFAAPDLLAVDLRPRCSGPYGVVTRVLNIGRAPVPPGVVVGFYAGDPNGGGAKLGEAYTTWPLFPLGSEDVALDLASVPAAGFYAVVDDGNPPHPWHECRTDNNITGPVNPACP